MYILIWRVATMKATQRNDQKPKDILKWNTEMYSNKHNSIVYK